MPITEDARYRLHGRLDEVLGPEDATTLMEHLPPGGWQSVATKADLKHLEGRLALRFTAIDERFSMVDQRFASLDHRFTAIDERFTALDERFTAFDHRFTALDQHMEDRVAITEHSLREYIARSQRTMLLALMAWSAGWMAFVYQVGQNSQG